MPTNNCGCVCQTHRCTLATIHQTRDSLQRSRYGIPGDVIVAAIPAYLLFITMAWMDDSSATAFWLVRKTEISKQLSGETTRKTVQGKHGAAAHLSEQ